MRHTGSMSCPGRCGALCGYSSNGCGRPNHQGAQPNHHHHHSHFDRWGEEDSYIAPRALCGSGWGVPGGSSGKLGAMQHYHRWTPFLFLRDPMRSWSSWSGWWQRPMQRTGTERKERRSEHPEQLEFLSRTPPPSRETPWEPAGGTPRRDTIGNAHGRRLDGVTEYPATEIISSISFLLTLMIPMLEHFM